MVLSCGTRYRSTFSIEMPVSVWLTSVGIPDASDGGQKVCTRSINERWLKLTISTLWVGMLELNETAAEPSKAPTFKPPVIPMDGTSSASAPISRATSETETPLMPNGESQVPFMVAWKEIRLGSTLTPPMNTNGLESM